MELGALVGDLQESGAVQLGMAVLLGGLVGLERELRGRPAGLRTMILVCLGSTLVMIVSNKLPGLSGDPAIMRIDPGRIAAGIVTGIGFLGAGVIIKLGDLVRGVTTAATIWFVAALGVALGLEHYGLATLTTFVVVAVLWLFGFLEKFVKSVVYRTVEVTVEADRSTELLNRAQQLFEERQMRVMEIRVAEDCEAAQTAFQFYIRTTSPQLSHETVKQLASGPSVKRVSWH